MADPRASSLSGLFQEQLEHDNPWRQMAYQTDSDRHLCVVLVSGTHASNPVKEWHQPDASAVSKDDSEVTDAAQMDVFGTRGNHWQ